MKAGTTPPILGPDGQPLPNSITEVQYIRLGGREQWVMIRGSDVATNPLLVLLHGGPGFSETAFWRYFNSFALEKAFTVVYWDQRGSGKSFDPSISKDEMTVEQFIFDLDELVDTVCHRCCKTKVAIFGHNWGSVLGPLYAFRFPDKVAAYVGCGQIGDWPERERATYDYYLAEAEQRGNGRMIRELKEIGPPPHNCDQLWKKELCLATLDGDLTLGQWCKMFQIHFSVPESSPLELFRLLKISRFSVDTILTEAIQLNLIELVPELKMPTLFFLGRQDHQVPSKISIAYINALISPLKEVVWFENSKHYPFTDEPEKFNTVMTNLVRSASLQH